MAGIRLEFVTLFVRNGSQGRGMEWREIFSSKQRLRLSTNTNACNTRPFDIHTTPEISDFSVLKL